MVVINLCSNQTFDWNMAFPASKRSPIPFCNSDTSNESFNSILLQRGSLCGVITLPHQTQHAFELTLSDTPNAPGRR